MASRAQILHHLALTILVSENFHSAASGMIRSPESSADA
jgi:hypothetical protein